MDCANTARKIRATVRSVACRYDTVQLARLPNEPLLSALVWSIRIVVIVAFAVEMLVFQRYVEYQDVTGGVSMWTTRDRIHSLKLADMTESDIPFYCKDSSRPQFYYPYRCQQKLMEKFYSRKIPETENEEALSDEDYDNYCHTIFGIHNDITFTEHVGCQDFDMLKHTGQTPDGMWISLTESIFPFECANGSTTSIDIANSNVDFLANKTLIGCTMYPTTNVENLTKRELDMFKRRTTMNIVGIEGLEVNMRFSYGTKKCLENAQDASCAGHSNPEIVLHRRDGKVITKSNFSSHTISTLDATNHTALGSITVGEWLEYASVTGKMDETKYTGATVFDTPIKRGWLTKIFGDVKVNHPTFRWSGMKLDVHIVYSNYRPGWEHFSWTSLVSRPRVDIYLDFQEDLYVLWKKKNIVWRADERGGATVVNSALEFNAIVSGRMGSVSFFAAISWIASVLVLWTTANIIVDLLAEFVLPHSESFTRVKYGGIRVRLKDISQAIQYKSESKTKLLREQATKSNKILPANNEQSTIPDSKRATHRKSPPTRCDTVNDLAPLLFHDTKRNLTSPKSPDNTDPCSEPSMHINSQDNRGDSDSDSKYSSPRQDDLDVHTVDPIAVYPSSYKRDSIRTPDGQPGLKVVKSKNVIMSDL